MFATSNVTTSQRRVGQQPRRPQVTKHINFILIPFTLTMTTACNNAQQPRQSAYETTGSIERIDPALDAIIDTNATIEIIAEGFEWSEGPLWVETEQRSEEHTSELQSLMRISYA